MKKSIKAAVAAVSSVSGTMRTSRNFVVGHPGDEEDWHPESDTVPDMEMSLAELIARQAQGLPIPVHEGYFDPVDDDGEPIFVPNLATLDRVDKANWSEALQAEMDELARPVPPKEDKGGEADGIEEA